MSAALEKLDGMLTAATFYQDPYPTYRRLREEDPVHWCEPWRQWVVTRHAEADEILKSPDRYLNAVSGATFMGQLPDTVRAELPYLERHYATPMLQNADPPEHRRVRTIAMKSFTPHVLRTMTPEITELIGRMLDPLEGRERTDLLESFAYPLPARVIARLLGVSEEASTRYADWSGDITAFIGTGSPEVERARRADQSLAEFTAHLEQEIARVREKPREDLLSILASEHDGTRLTDRELIAACVILLFAGHETTANLIASGLLVLLQNPEQLALVRESPELMANAVEELLRFEGPVQRLRRVAGEDTELGGRSIAKGDLVMVFVGSANRDPEVFEEPDRLDVQRKIRHLAFGHGLHFCVGAGLSRIEAPIALNELLARFPRMRVAPGDVEWKPNLTFRGLEALNLELG
jgi:pimeloyl-[acyl-carrier protein] synthase